MKHDRPSLQAINKLIKSKFSASFMSDAKWDKLIAALCDRLADGFFVNYKLVYGEEVNSTYFDVPDFKPFFAEPILYKEVEWIEFPSEFEDCISRDNLKAGNRLYKQDITAIEDFINALGQFKCVADDNKLRLYAYIGH
ncbi:DUF6678 family protein [Marinicella sediminis]|uniref:DUF6678 family protein n=1 Tax=Marinicella sediminis TaxID=1792834 RepID=A0ABV7J7I6_9GAMM|nr:DUF6678 family protein [Marinicella sediminis]